MNAPLLSTKFYIPALRAEWVSRRRLLERLDEGRRLGRGLTLVAAPAGYGKTSLIATWARQGDWPAAWLSLDENDDDPIRFWTYAIAALQTVRPDVGETTLAMIRAMPPSPIDAALTALINELAEDPAPVVLVLDDYQVIRTPAIHDGVAFLIEYPPPQMHLVLSTRIDPPLNVARLRVNRRMTEVRAGDLRFTPDEAARFLNDVSGLGLSSDDIAALEIRTEGWIAGLQVAAMAMQGRDDVPGFIDAFSGSHRHILSYLIEEVFLRQPAHVQDFLLRTSILNRLSGSLCDAVRRSLDASRGAPQEPAAAGPGSGQEILEELEASNLFVVPLDEAGRWYRYHHLFADALRARLQRDASGDEIQALHRAASDWHERRGHIDEAVGHAFRIEDYERVGGLIERHAGPMIGRSELTTLLRWLGALPDGVVRTSATLSMIYAWALLASSQIDAVEPRLRDVEHALGIVADRVADPAELPPDLRGALGELLCVRANLAFHGGDLSRVLALSQRAAGCLDDRMGTSVFHSPAVLRSVIAFNTALAHEYSGDLDQASDMFERTISLSISVENPHLVMISFSHLATIQQVQGRLYLADETCRRAIRFAEESASPPSPFLGLVYVALGAALLEWNELERAEEALNRGVELARPWNTWETLVAGAISQARLMAARAEWDAADRLLDDLAGALPLLQAPWGMPRIRAEQAHLAVRRGDLGAARTWLAELDLTGDRDPPFGREPEAIVLARALAVVGRPEAARRLCDRLFEAAQAGGRLGRAVEVLAVRALALDAQGEAGAALADVRRALTLAEPEGYIRVFVDEGVAMARLLQRVGVAPRYVARLLAAFPPTPPPAAAAVQAVSSPASELVEPLSDRELETLRLMAQGLTNQEIAEALTLSVNTIKTHARNIYGKLGVSNRTEAAARARELRLISAR